jgi:hypothetical protein
VINGLDFGATPNDGAYDHDEINDAIKAAAEMGGNVVVYLPQGTYRFGDKTSIKMRSKVVLRGAGPGKTVLTGDRGSGNVRAAVDFVGGAEGWVNIVNSSLPKGTNVIQLADVSSLNVGDFLHMLQDNNPSYIQDAAGGKLYMSHIAKVVAISGNRVTLDRPLRHAFGTGFRPRAQRMKPVANAGLEDMKVMFDLNAFSANESLYGEGRFGPTSNFEYAVNCWVKNVSFYHAHKNHVRIQRSARITVTGSRFEKIYEDSSGRYSIALQESAVDNLITNGISVNLKVGVLFQRGASGNVYSYNFHVGSTQYKGVHFGHGQYPHENLIEGVDSMNNTFQIGDNYWGQNGPRNTAFRNRLRGTGWFMTHDSGAPDPITPDFNLLLNSGYAFYRAPFCNYGAKGNCGNVDDKSTGFWAERNFATDTRPDGSPSGSSSYGFVMRSPESTTTLIETLHEGPRAPSSWQGLEFPASLYLDGPPEFWGKNMPWPAIGADVDDHSLGFVKLPAQLRYEGTPVDEGEPPPSRPAAPVLLDN